MTKMLALKDIEAVALTDRAVREKEKERRAASIGSINTADTDWLRRDARELTWKDKTRREWAADDHKDLDSMLVKSGTLSMGEDECACDRLHARPTSCWRPLCLS